MKTDIEYYTEKAVDNHLDMGTLINKIREAFKSYADGDSKMPSKTYLDLPQFNGDFRSMPAYVELSYGNYSGVKWVNVHPDNPSKHELPTVMAMVLLSDPSTGQPLATIEASELTGKRTGAVAGVATDLLADHDSEKLGILGLGQQAYRQLEAITTVRDIDEVWINDANESKMEQFIEQTSDENFSVYKGSKTEIGHCDVLSTVTPVEEPILEREHIGDNIHINAMGADAEGKQEMSAKILEDADIIVDDYDQAIHSGEVNCPIRDGIISEDDITSSLGEALNKSNHNYNSITLFDSTGLAIQDVTAASILYENL